MTQAPCHLVLSNAMGVGDSGQRQEGREKRGRSIMACNNALNPPKTLFTVFWKRSSPLVFPWRLNLRLWLDGQTVSTLIHLLLGHTEGETRNDLVIKEILMAYRPHFEMLLSKVS